MEFPLIGLAGMNSSAADAEADRGRSLCSRSPAVAALYVGVLGVAAVVGTFGNVVLIATVTVKRLLGRRHPAETARNDAGWAFVANLALSDMIVTAVINPLAIAGQCEMCGLAGVQ